ncbi:MAG: pantoate--beta-alanine ligase [Panacagrimonas sp.]
MRTVHSVAELRAEIAAWKRDGRRIGFVPTMGNLHAGHLDLIARARTAADQVVASVFVNPLQFGPNEDFERYPRSLPDDQAQLMAAGCDLLFAPSVAEMYPRGRDQLSGVRVPALADQLEGEFRPGFFDGVATVVSILFNQVRPDVAVFGHKDWQQLQVIRRMVADLHLPIEILGQPTARAADGLALSSRNQYLTPDERRLAPALYRVLSEVAEALREGRRDHAALQAEAMQRLAAIGFRSQYVVIRAQDLSEPRAERRDRVILAAAFLGTTRLIDNLSFDL